MVVGFIILTGLIVYLIISIVMIFFGVRYARKNGIPGWKGGVSVTVHYVLTPFLGLDTYESNIFISV